MGNVLNSRPSLGKGRCDRQGRDQVRHCVHVDLYTQKLFSLDFNPALSPNHLASHLFQDVKKSCIALDGSGREVFNPLKILNGLRKACEKRPVSIDSIEKIVSRIELYFQERGEREIRSAEIGEKVMEELHRLDGVAYVRFASVYRHFKDIREFMDELKDLLENKEEAAKT